MKLKRIWLPVLLIPMLTLGSCSTKSLEENEKIGLDYFSDAKESKATTYTATFTGFFKTLWESENVPEEIRIITGNIKLVSKLKNGSIDDSNIEDFSAMLYVPTKIDKATFMDVYSYINEELAYGSNKTGYFDVSTTEAGDLKLGYYESNMKLKFYGLQTPDGKIQDRYRFTTSTARWNIEFVYGKDGVIKSERIFVSQTHTSDKNASADIVATYTVE